MYFGSINGLYLLLFAVPLVILYLIKAKPKEIVLPSLLFFLGDKKVEKYNSILRKFLVRLLFFLQLLFIVVLALSSANLFVNIPMDAYSLNTVVIIDVSASMGAKDGTINRLDASKQELLDLVKGRVTVILAEENPVVVLVNVSSSKARALISNLQPKDLSTRIDSAILLANDILGGERGNIVVYSDFILNKEDDLLAAKKIVEANDKRLVLIQTGEKQSNLGFITLSLSRGKGEAVVKNFGEKNEVIDIKLMAGGDKKESKRVEIKPYSVERINFDIMKGDSTLELSRNDKLNSDNKLFIINPYDAKSNILFITNDQRNNLLLDALQSNSQFEVKVTVPPVIPDLEYDLIVVSKIDMNMLLPNTFKDIKKYKENGGKVIIASQDNINSLDFQGLVGFGIGSLTNKGGEICIDFVNEFTSRISNPRCFTSISKYHNINIADNSSLVFASTEEGIPALIMEENLFYYGIIDDSSGFKDQINYPLFWDDLINYMLGRENLANFNFKTGDVFLLGENKSNKVILDEAGIFNIGNKRVAVNLLNERESDIFRDSAIMNKTEFEGKYEKVNLDVNLDQFLLLLAFLIFGFELYYIKKRGDL